MSLWCFVYNNISKIREFSHLRKRWLDSGSGEKRTGLGLGLVKKYLDGKLRM